MSKTITAKFDSIDAATIAASNAKDRCDNVKGVKIKYKADKRHNEPSYVFTNSISPTDTSNNPSVLQNGIFPLAVNVDSIGIGHNDYYSYNRRKATVEITATDNSNYGKICSTLRQLGGLGVKIK